MYGLVREHAIWYWKAIKEKPKKILFLRHENLRENVNYYVKRLGDFVGAPLKGHEKRKRAISSNIMRNLEVNKSGTLCNG